MARQPDFPGSARRSPSSLAAPAWWWVVAALVAGWPGVSPRAEPADWAVRTWPATELVAVGGESATVRGIAAVGDGTLVVATTDGVLRFNGSRFSPVPLGLPRDEPPFVTTITSGRPAHLALALASGKVLTVDAGRIASRGPPLVRLTGDFTPALTRTADAIWITLPDGRVGRLPTTDRDRRIYGPAEGVPTCREPGLVATTGGETVLACTEGLFVFEDDRFKKRWDLPAGRGIAAPARDGGIWLTAHTRIVKAGLAMPPEELPTPSADFSVPTVADAIRTARGLFEDPAGRLWISSSRHGLFVLADGRLSKLPIGDTWTTNVAEDGAGGLWAGTRLAIHRIRPAVAWPTEQPTWKPIASLCDDGAGLLWFVTQDGEIFTEANSAGDGSPPNPADMAALQREKPTCVASAANGIAWIGLDSQGIVRHDQGGCETIPLPEPYRGGKVETLLATRTGDVWAAVGEALLRYRDGEWLACPGPAAASDPATTAASQPVLLTEDAAGRIWSARDRTVLVTTPDGEPFPLNAPPPAAGRIDSLLASPRGSVWLGVRDGGLLRWKEGGWTAVSARHGLPSTDIVGMTLDHDGRLWCGCPRLVFATSLAELEAIADGTRGLCHCWVLPPVHETAFLESVATPRCGMLTDDAGRVIVARQRGLAICDPARLPAIQPPRVAIEAVTSDRVARYGSALTAPAAGQVEVGIPAGGRGVEIEFAARTLVAPTDARLEYRLDGIDDDWRPAPLHATAAYAFLPTGTHRFHVRSSTHAGASHSGSSLLALTIAPRPWETWWFRAGAGAAVAVATLLVASFRSRRRIAGFRQQAAIDRERMRIARDMHDEVGTSLTQIALLAELAKADPAEEQADRLDVVARISRQAVVALDELVWSVNPSNDTLTHLLSYACGLASETLAEFGIAAEIQRPATVPPVAVGVDFRRNVLLIVKEAITNVIKHADARRVTVRIVTSERRLMIEITDDGRGLPPPPRQDSGLANIRQRATDLGGSCRIQAAPGGGTGIHLDLPLPEPARLLT
jgi:ligand-binding sensor domain-containing protein/two-component sensor histidine kinase